MRYILAILLTIFSTQLWAEDEPIPGLQLAQPEINRMDVESIKRGAKLFATNCLSCHTMRYLKYDKLAQEAGVTFEKMPFNVANWPYGVTPPDLSLTASVRGIDWIYTYLHSFYTDTARPTGVNNLLVHNTAMPAILAPYQGMQTLVKDPTYDIAGAVQWYDVLVLTKEGTMTPEEFDAATADITNFLAYAAEPFYAEQHKIGWWVLGFLVILFVLMFMLKKEYWRDVKRNKE